MTATKIQPGDDLHLTSLMAPHSLNFVTGADRAALLAYGRDVFAAGLAGAAPAAVAGPADDLAELAMLNKLVELGTQAYGALAKSNSDDGPAGTAAYVRWQERRAEMGELIRAHKAPALEAPAAPVVPADEFRGDTSSLVRNIIALLEMDAEGCLVPHGVGGHARGLLSAAAARLAAAPQAPAAPAEGEVLVEVIGLTGSGKSAICGEIEILCRALGLDVSWPDGDPEKNMTHAEWTAAIEAYKPRVRIVERNVPRQSNGGPAK